MWTKTGLKPFFIYDPDGRFSLLLNQSNLKKNYNIKHDRLCWFCNPSSCIKQIKLNRKTMKKVLCSLALTLIGGFSLLNAQDQPAETEKKFAPKGKVSAKVFANYHSTIIGDSITENAFELERAYIGYKSDFDENWAGEVKLDIGSQNESEYSNFLRYAFFKNAYVKYHTDKLNACFGLINVYQHKVQEKFWGYRYIFKSFQDKHKMSTSADIGLSLEYKFNKIVSIDYAITNGEGYKNIQSDKVFKNGVGLTLKPIKQLVLRSYFDYIKRDDNDVISLAEFIGFKLEKFRIAAEYNLQLNNKAKDLDLYGMSAYSTLELTDKFEVFGRFDVLRSNLIKDGEGQTPWNIKKDGSAIMGGVQFKPADQVKLSLNYRNWIYYANDIDDKHWVYVNLEFKL